MPVVDVRVVRMAVLYGGVRVMVAVCTTSIPFCVVRMLVVLIVAVFMRMLHFLVQMVMRVVFGEMQPHAQPHQRRGDPKLHTRFFCEHQ